jgi:hypothetical protein
MLTNRVGSECEEMSSETSFGVRWPTKSIAATFFCDQGALIVPPHPARSGSIAADQDRATKCKSGVGYFVIPWPVRH